MSNYWINVINTAHMVTGLLSVIYGVIIIITVAAIGIDSTESIKYYVKYIKYGLLFLVLLILTFIFTSPIN